MAINVKYMVAKQVAKGGKGGEAYLKPAEMRGGNPCGKGGKGYLKPAEMRGKVGGNIPPSYRGCSLALRRADSASSAAHLGGM